MGKLTDGFKKKLFEIAWSLNTHPCSTLCKLYRHELIEVHDKLKKDVKKEFDLEAAKRVK